MEPQTNIPQGQVNQMQQPMPVGAKEKGDAGKVVMIVLLVLLLGLAAALGYFYKSTNDSLKSKSQELSKAYQTIEEFQAIIDREHAEKEFLAGNYNEIQKNTVCNSNPALVGDMHLNEKFAVLRYLCANESTPIRFSAYVKRDHGYEFTYGSTAQAPNDLPGYIYDTDPEFFGGQYGATRF